MTKNPKEIEDLAKKIRLLTLKTIFEAGSGHIGSSLSLVEIIATLLFSEMNWLDYLEEVKDKNNEKQLAYFSNPDLKRDRFVLSKGHGVPSWYAATALAGFIKEEELKTLRVINSRLQGHPERNRFPFIDATTGSLGQGQSEALGYALAKKIQGRDERVFCVIGDGESNEGQVWEAAMSAPKFKLDNLVVIVDFNKKQSEGTNREIMDIEPLDKKWEAFNWHVQRVDGHDVTALLKAFEEIKEIKGKPHVIIADTQKGCLGKDCVFMSGGHNPTISQETYDEAINFLAA
jgi:transketolase